MLMKYSIFSVMIFTGSVHAQVGEIVALPNFGIDRTEVTIGQFDRYVRATGTTTRAEKRVVALSMVPVGSVVAVGLGESQMATRRAQICLPFIWILKKRKPIAVGRGAVYPQGLNGN